MTCTSHQQYNRACNPPGPPVALIQSCQARRQTTQRTRCERTRWLGILNNCPTELFTTRPLFCLSPLHRPCPLALLQHHAIVTRVKCLATAATRRIRRHAARNAGAVLLFCFIFTCAGASSPRARCPSTRGQSLQPVAARYWRRLPPMKEGSMLG